jgi:SAM-dependent methyltransferase
MDEMRRFVKEEDLGDAHVIDVGSCDVNGTYRELFAGKYVGADVRPGPNVDVIIGSSEWRDMPEADAVISGQAIEHAADPQEFLETIYSKVKPGGMVCIIAPSAGPGHLPYAGDHPTEVWSGTWNGHWGINRMTFAVEMARFDVISCTINPGCEWQDCVCVARKPIGKVENDADK